MILSLNVFARYTLLVNINISEGHQSKAHIYQCTYQARLSIDRESIMNTDVWIGISFIYTLGNLYRRKEIILCKEKHFNQIVIFNINHFSSIKFLLRSQTYGFFSRITYHSVFGIPRLMPL